MMQAKVVLLMTTTMNDDDCSRGYFGKKGEVLERRWILWRRREERVWTKTKSIGCEDVRIVIGVNNAIMEKKRI